MANGDYMTIRMNALTVNQSHRGVINSYGDTKVSTSTARLGFDGNRLGVSVVPFVTLN